MATQTATRRVIYAPTDSVTRTVSVDLHPSDNAHTLRQKVADKTGVPPGDTSVQTWDASMTDQVRPGRYHRTGFRWLFGFFFVCFLHVGDGF